MKFQIFFFLNAFVAASSSAEVLDRVVAKVNGDIVTLSEFTNRQATELQRARVPSGEISAYLRENNARILQEAIDELLLIQRGQELGLRMRPEYLRDVIENIKKENKITSDDEFQKQLRSEGLSLEALKRNVERSILTRQILSREIEPKVVVSEADARAYYEQNKVLFTHAAKVHLQEIVLPASSEALSSEVVRRARAGEDFGVLVKAHSVAVSRAADGDIGLLPVEDLAASLRAAADPLQIGAISDPIATPDGLRIIKILGRTDAGTSPFESVKTDIMKTLSQERKTSVLAAYLQELRKTALIDIRVREVPLQASVPQAPSVIETPAAAGMDLSSQATGSDDEFNVQKR